MLTGLLGLLFNTIQDCQSRDDTAYSGLSPLTSINQENAPIDLSRCVAQW